MKKKFFLISFLALILSSCMKGEKVDLIVHNAVIVTMNNESSIQEAMAIRNGKIIEVGPERQILNKYRADETIDAKGRDIYPGFTDAHGHLLLYAQQKLSLDLVDSKSLNEVLVRCEKYKSLKGKDFIVGTGWDQSLWGTNELPTNKELNELFPTIPVCLYRIDGHAALVNDCLLKKANITAASFVDGGEVSLDQNGKPTGILIDNAIGLVEASIPKFSDADLSKAIIEIQEELFQYGITGVHEAGIDYRHISLFRNMVKNGSLKLDVYAMLRMSKENLNFAKKYGQFRYKNLSIQSFKVWADGALGSRGAYLKKSYDDAAHSHGLLLTSVKELKDMAQFCIENDYQMNTHGIGDSANALVLEIYKDAFQKKKDHRFRIEHAQVIDPNDFKKFAEYSVFPSVQPTHAVSDQRWAINRIGADRIKGAYAYKTLLSQFGMLAIGTDFPIERTNPFLTIHAAVQRRSATDESIEGFYMNEAISLEEVLRGMTIWAAFASFQENKLGSLEKGKDATFVIFERKVQSQVKFEQNYSWMTFIKGLLVYDANEL